MKQIKINEMVLRLLPRMIDNEIELQTNLVEKEIEEGDKRYLNFRREAISALEDLKEQVITKM